MDGVDVIVDVNIVIVNVIFFVAVDLTDVAVVVASDIVGCIVVT